MKHVGEIKTENKQIHSPISRWGNLSRRQIENEVTSWLHQTAF